MLFCYGVAMTLKQLRYLIAIAEAGSFSAAARDSYIAQPALSRQIGLLESELEMQLLERRHGGTELTDAGRRLYEIARSVIQKVDSVKDELESTRGNPKGRVAIAIPVSAASLLLPEIVIRARDKFPAIELQITDGMSSAAGHAIELGHVDFGVVPNAEELELVSAEPVLLEELWWYGRMPMPTSGPTISFAEALGAPLVLPPRSLHLRRRVEQAAMEAGLELNVSFEQNSAQSISSLVRAGLACTITNWPPLEDQEQQYARRIIEPSIRRTISLAYSVHRPLSFPASCMRDLVRTTLIDLAESGRWKGSLIAPREPATAGSADA